MVLAFIVLSAVILFPYESNRGILKTIGFAVGFGGVTLGAVGLVTLIALTSETPGGVIVNVFTVGLGAVTFMLSAGGVIFTPIVGADKFIEIVGAVTVGGVAGSCGFGTSIVTGFKAGSKIVGAVIGVVTFKLIAGRTTSLGISICGLIAISSFVTDFGRTFAII